MTVSNRDNSIAESFMKKVFAPMLLLIPQLLWAGTIHIGSTTYNPTAEMERLLPLANYLGKQLQSEGIDQGRVIVTKSVPEMATLMREGKVDLYVDSPFPSLALSRLSGSKLILRRWKKGLGEYYSVIFSRKDSGVSRLENLNGKILVFEAPFSTTGYFLPKMIFLQKGIKLVTQDSSDLVRHDRVGYRFSGNDENTMAWVIKGIAVAGAMDHESYVKEAKADLHQLQIILKSSSVPRHIVSHRADLPPKLAGRVKEILLRMDQSEEGRKALKDFGETTKFDEIPNALMAPLLKGIKFFDSEFNK